MRTPRVDKNGLQQGAWSAEEDRKLINYIRRYRIWNWTLMPKYAGLARSGKSCRLRWVNYLDPNIRRGNITKEEEKIIIDMYEQLGSRWSKIAARLPGRTDNEIKNYWHSHLKKLFKEKSKKSIEPLVTEIPSLETTSETSDGSDFHSFWTQSFFTGNDYKEYEKKDTHVQDWYQEPLSPYGIYNNEYWLNEFGLMDGAEQFNVYYKGEI